MILSKLRNVGSYENMPRQQVEKISSTPSSPKPTPKPIPRPKKHALTINPKSALRPKISTLTPTPR